MAKASAAASSAHGHRRRFGGIVGGGAGLLSMVPMNRKIIAVASAALITGSAGWLTAQPDEARIIDEPSGWPAVAHLQPAIGTLFADADAMGETRALLILRDGKVIYERYGPGFNQDSKLISWSMAKSITGVLIGLLVAEGRLALDAPAPVAAWQRSGDPRGSITLRHLLNMSSGLEHVESGEKAWEGDRVTLLFGDGAADMAGFAESKPAVAKAGEQFNYSSATSVILADILADTLAPGGDAAARRDAVLDLLRTRLAEPAGMTSLTPEFDAAGTMVGGSIMHATARDYAKFGELLRRRGVAGDQRLLPESWIDFMLTPSPANPGYGGHIWLNRPRAAGETTRLLRGEGPNDLFACTGHQGQYILVSPSQRLTIVRLGISRENDQLPNVREKMRAIAAGL